MIVFQVCLYWQEKILEKQNRLERSDKVTKDSNLDVPVYMEIGTGLTNLYIPMVSGVTTLGIANIPTDQTKARVSAIGLAGHCVYHNEYHSINDLGSGGITIQ